MSLRGTLLSVLKKNIGNEHHNFIYIAAIITKVSASIYRADILPKVYAPLVFGCFNKQELFAKTIAIKEKNI